MVDGAGGGEDEEQSIQRGDAAGSGVNDQDVTLALTSISRHIFDFEC